MATNTAEVKHLVAEVRVLMIGARQITLSVARQLDYVALEEMEPFGRVNLSPNDARSGPGEVIGRCKESGALVLASYLEENRAPFIKELSTGRPAVCSKWLRSDRSDPVVSFCGQNIRLSRSIVDNCGKSHTNRPDDRCDGWSARGAEAEIAVAIQAHQEYLRPHIAASRLPLIVLAGLK